MVAMQLRMSNISLPRSCPPALTDVIIVTAARTLAGRYPPSPWCWGTQGRGGGRGSHDAHCDALTPSQCTDLAWPGHL